MAKHARGAQGCGGWRFGMALAGALWLALGSGRTQAVPEVQVLTQNETEVIFEVRCEHPTLTAQSVNGRAYVAVRIPGANSGDNPGEPDLPYIECQIALPPGREAVVEILEAVMLPLAVARPLPVATEDRRVAPDAWGTPADALPDIELTYPEDGRCYAGAARFPQPIAVLRGARNWRHFRVVPVAVTPIQYDPGPGELLWSPVVRVRVAFVQAKAAPAAGAATGRQPYTIAEPGWESIFGSEILNYDTARGYRTRPLLPARTLSLGRAAEQEFRVAVDTLGLYQLTFEELVTAGLTASDLDWASVKLAVRGFDDADDDDPFREWPVAFLPLDSDEDGRFDPGESLIFYGEDAWDFFDLSPGDRRYGRQNIYWLVCGGDAGPTMATSDSWFDWTGVPPVVTYVRTAHFEDNIFYMPIVARDDTSNPDAGPQGIHTDHYNWTYLGVVEGPNARPFKVVKFDLPSVYRATEVCVHLQGQGYISGSSNAPHLPRLWLSRSSTPEDTTWAFPGNPYMVSTVDDLEACAGVSALPGSTIGTGHNYVKLYLPRRNDGIDNVDGFGIGIDWVEVTFEGKLELQNHRLTMPLDGHTGRRRLSVGRVPSQTVRVFDVGDARAPVSLNVGATQLVWNATNQSWDLKLQIECPESPARSELLIVEGEQFDRLAAGAVTLRPGSPVTHFTGEDYVAIFARQFASEVQPLLAHRQEQGHAVLGASIEDVCDTYNGGRLHPYAIKRLLRQMWRQSAATPDYLLLFGDASNDIGQYLVDLEYSTPRVPSDTSWVTTITIPGHAFSATGTELVSCDHWFVDNLAGAWGESMTREADMRVGRVSCGSATEASTYVSKVLAYEQSDEAAAWRRRLLFVSDDDFSSEIGGLGSGGSYRRRSAESSFLEITRNAANLITGDSLFSDFEVDSIYLNAVMDSVPELGRCLPDTTDPNECLRDTEGNVVPVDYVTEVNMVLSQQYGQTVVHDLVAESLDRGVLAFAYQGHSNRFLLAHEYIFMDGVPYNRYDVQDLTNVSKPFIFMGFGCHLCAFAGHDEGNRYVGDCMAEALLFCCPGGPRAAIGAIGSSDYETIGHEYEEKVFQAMFPDPQPDDTGRLRWRLGDVFEHSKSKLATSKRERLTYTLLGDPALRIGITPPAVTLRLNGVPWEPAGAGEYATTREDDSLRVRIELKDESTTELPLVQDHYGAVPSDQLIVGTIDDRGGRRRVVYYATRVQRQAYSLSVQANDYDGTRREVVVKLPFEIAVYEQTGAELEPLADGDPVPGTAALALTVRSAAHLAPLDIRFLANGEPVSLEQANYAGSDGAPGTWTLRFEELPAVTGLSVDLAVEVAQRDGTWATLHEQSQPVGAVELHIEDLAWIPNPFGEGSTLVYRLTDQASRARLRVFTVSGREILSDPHLPTTKGERHHVWDGRDADGDPVANGLYFFEFTVWNTDGRRADRVVDKLVRAR
jgi:hypothetical protein